MTSPQVQRYPNSELVLIAWLENLFASLGYPAATSMVGTTLPQDETKWSAPSAMGFIQVGSVGGDIGDEVPLSNPVLSVNCWANRMNSDRPPWGMAANLAATITQNVWKIRPQRLHLPSSFPDVQLYTGKTILLPRREPGDKGSYARYTTDILLHWAPVSTP